MFTDVHLGYVFCYCQIYTVLMHKEPLSVNIEARRNGKLKVKEMLYFMFKYVSVERKKMSTLVLKKKN